MAIKNFNAEKLITSTLLNDNAPDKVLSISSGGDLKTTAFSAFLASGITTLAGYGISDTKANFNTALSDGSFLFTGDVVSFPGFTDIDTDYGAETVTSDWNFIASGVGGFTDYDVNIGDTDGTPTYGIARLGDSVIGRTSHVGSYNLNGAFIIQNIGGAITGDIEMAVIDSSGLIRFALPKSAVGNATYNPRSMIIAGPAVADSDIVTVGYWQTQGIFHNLSMDTGTNGADLGVQNDVEVEGDLYIDSILESTPAAGVTIDGLLIKDGGITASIVGITGTKAQFDTAVTDGNIMYIGDAPTAHTHVIADITDFTDNSTTWDALVSNITTNLSVGTITGTTLVVVSSDGTDATLPEANTTEAGLLSAAKWNEIVANNAKVTFPGFTSLNADYGYTEPTHTASEIAIVDVGTLITAAEVEGALAENRTAINLNTSKTSFPGFGTLNGDYGYTEPTHALPDLTDVVSATNTSGFALIANGTTGYVGRALVIGDITDFTDNSTTWDALVSNVSTNLSVGTITATTVDVNSSDGTNATLVEANATQAGLLGAGKWNEIVANNAKITFPGWGSVTNHTDVVSATNTNRFVLVANGTTGYVGRALVEADISDLGTYSTTGHTHLLAAGATDVTATAAEVNLLDLSGLTAGHVLSADTATTASWKAPAGGTDGENDFVASGAIATGDVVGLRSDGKVEVIQDVVAGDTYGAKAVYESATAGETSTVYDTANNKVIVTYYDTGNSNYGTAVVGTVSGTTISFGTPVVFKTSIALDTSIAFDVPSGKVVIAYSASSKGYAIIGTVSGTSISFGTEVEFNTSGAYSITATYSPANEKVLISYSDGGNSSYGTAVVGTVSGTSISFGTKVAFNATATVGLSSAYNTAGGNVIIAYEHSAGGAGRAIIASISDTTVSYGTSVQFDAGAVQFIDVAYDIANEKAVIVYQDTSNSSYGTAIIGTITGTSISFGTAVVFATASTFTERQGRRIVYDSINEEMFIAYTADTATKGKSIIGTVSGTSITFGTATEFNAANAGAPVCCFDPTDHNVIVSYYDTGNLNYGTSRVYSPAQITTNVATTIGIATEAISDTATGTITTLGGINNQQSALTTGSGYYVDYTGAVTLTQPTDAYGFKRLGVATSATEILLDLDIEQEQVSITMSQVSDLSISIDELDGSLKDEISLGAATAIGWNAGITFDKALTAAWTATFTSPVVGKTIMVVTTGNYTITWPTGVDATNDFADYDGTKRNVHFITCVSTSIPLYASSIKVYTI